MKDKHLVMIGAGISVAVLIAGGVFLAQSGGDGDKFAQCRTGVVAGGAGSLGGSFTLTDETGARVTDAQVFTKPSLLYFGYTFCPDVCPLDSARNAEATDLLEERGIDVQPVFISVDPKRDTPEALRDFTDALHPKMLGLTGSVEEVTAASRAWRGFFQIRDEGDPDFYLVDHSTQTYLVLPQDGTVEFFNRDVTPEDMADRVACFTAAAG